MTGLPHFAHPFRLTGAKRFATVEQDSPDELSQCVAVALSTPIGSRLEMPDYGTPRMDFGLPDLADIQAALDEAEPRVKVDLSFMDGLGPGASMAELTVAVRPHVSDGSEA